MVTNNGFISTTHHRGCPYGFEVLLADFGIVQKNRIPNHPQTQCKVERFAQTFKKWLRARPPATTLADMQGVFDEFTHLDNGIAVEPVDTGGAGQAAA